MEHIILTEKNVSDLHNIKGMAQKNIAEKVSHQKLQRQIDKQKSAFVKQHSKNENEIKSILQRLQLEQHVHDGCIDDLSEDDELPQSSSESDEEDTMTNPYPVMIMPKFGLTSPRLEKAKGSKFPSKFQRRKSLEYEDVDKIKSTTSGVRTTFLAASFISKLRSPFHKRVQEENDEDENWCKKWEETSSIRRPRKTIAEQNQHKLLQRGKSEILSRPSSSMSIADVSSRRTDLSRHGSRKEDNNFKNLTYEGTVENGSLSPRGISKSRRGGSLKERKTTPGDIDAANMRRCNSTKERRKKYPVSQKNSDETETLTWDKSGILSRKNSKEKTQKSKENDNRLTSNNMQDTMKSANSKELLSPKSSNEDMKAKYRIKESHKRQGSLKERGEEKLSGSSKRFSGIQRVFKSAVGNKKTVKKQKSLSTDSSPIGSASTSPTSKGVQFVF